MYGWDDAGITRDVELLASSDRPLVGLSMRPDFAHHGGIDIAQEARRMETLFVWIVVIAALLALDAGALLWGTDSRDPLPDDHHR
jgi:hypothetical protein